MSKETWGTAAATTDIDSDNGRTVSPFSGVIAEYQKRLDKAVRRSKTNSFRTKAALYFADQIVILRELDA